MCDIRRSVTVMPRLRWGPLVAMPVALVVFMLVDLYVPMGARTALAGAAAAAAWGVMVCWVGANRVALDQLDWCACAPDTVRIRIIPSIAPRPLEPAAGDTVTTRLTRAASAVNDEELVGGSR